MAGASEAAKKLADNAYLTLAGRCGTALMVPLMGLAVSMGSDAVSAIHALDKRLARVELRVDEAVLQRVTRLEERVGKIEERADRATERDLVRQRTDVRP